MTTPKLTRVWRRDYGGDGVYLVDKPGTKETLLSFTIAIGEAIDKWEPRYRLRRVWFEEAGQDGRFLINFDGVYYPRGHLGDFETGVERGVELPLPLGFFVTGGFST
jgi:phage baseplate assembly protein W